MTAGRLGAAALAAALLLGRPVLSPAAPERRPPEDPAAAAALSPAQGWLALGGAYAAAGAYAVDSWYRGEEQRPFHNRDEGWFGADTYAGGADKLGHLYASYVLTRAGHDLLRAAGHPPRAALAASAALDTAFLTAVEIKDGYTEGLGFSWGDIAANLAGSVLAAAFVHWPGLDRALDLRLEYRPSPEYARAVREEKAVNAIEDYTGMTFGLWYHLGELPGVRGSAALGWLRFLDVGATYAARNYRPAPAEPRARERELSLAVGLNLAEVSRALAAGRAPRLTRATDLVFEYFTVPGTALRAR